MSFLIFQNKLFFNFNEPLTQNHIDELRELLNQTQYEIFVGDEEGNRFDHPIELLSKVENIEILHLQDYRIKINKLPPNLKEFYSGNCFNKDIIFPDSVEKIVFGIFFNKYIRKYPKNLKSIEFGKKFNQNIDNLPNSLEYLYLCGDFNQSIDNLPSSLKKISFFNIFYSFFNKPVDNLPSNLEEIYFFGDFNQPIDNLPSSLKILFLNGHFFQSIDNLPTNLIKIIFSKSGIFNYSINNLPNSVEEIILPNIYSLPIEKIPDKLQNIEVLKKYPYINDLKKLFKNVSIRNNENYNQK